MIKSLKLQNISFSYAGGEKLFENLTHDLPLDRSVNFIGEQGCGRSTLFKLLVGLKDPISGTVLFNDQPMSEMSFEEFLPFRLRIGYSFDLGGLLNNKTILENLTLPLLYHKLATESEANRKAMDLLEKFGVENNANLRPSSVPGRTRKAAIVARSLILNPELLVLDDPTTGLSAEGKSALKELIIEHQVQHNLRHIYYISEDPEFQSFMGAMYMVVVSKNELKVA